MIYERTIDKIANEFYNTLDGKYLKQYINHINDNKTCVAYYEQDMKQYSKMLKLYANK